MISIADQVVVSASNFLTVVLLARALGPREFGVFSIAWLIVLFFASSAFCGTTANNELFDTPPFADPGETVEMDPEWVKRKLKHPNNIDADLYAILSYQMFDLWGPWIDEFAR